MCSCCSVEFHFLCAVVWRPSSSITLITPYVLAIGMVKLSGIIFQCICFGISFKISFLDVKHIAVILPFPL